MELSQQTLKTLRIVMHNDPLPDGFYESRDDKGNLIITDLRGVDPIYTGNRFMIYSMYPEQNISAWIVDGKGGQGCSAAVGYSILNKTSKVNVGSLMLKYGGGGHEKVGTCQFTNENMESDLPKMLSELSALANK